MGHRTEVDRFAATTEHPHQGHHVAVVKEPAVEVPSRISVALEQLQAHAFQINHTVETLATDPHQRAELKKLLVQEAFRQALYPAYIFEGLPATH
jgi:hypothetical protein